MSIQGIGSQSPSASSAVQKIVANPIQKSLPTDASSAPARGSDKVELSGLSQHLASLKAGGDVRADKVAEIRAQIESGTYETDDKVNGAIDGLLDDLNV